MPRVSVVLPAALSPAIASMTGRGESGTDSLRRSRMSLSGIRLTASSPSGQPSGPGPNWTFHPKRDGFARPPPRRGDRGGTLGRGSPGRSTPEGDVPAWAAAYGRRMDALGERASALVAPPKGILAAGPGGAAMAGRLAAAGVPPTGANRRAFRELLVTAPGLRAGVTGVILDPEGMAQRSAGGPPPPAAGAAAGAGGPGPAGAGRRPPPRGPGGAAPPRPGGEPP